VQLLAHRQGDAQPDAVRQHGPGAAHGEGPHLRRQLQRAPRHVGHGRPCLLQLNSYTVVVLCGCVYW